MKRFTVKHVMNKEVYFEGTNEDYVYLCDFEKKNNYSEFETCGDIEDDYTDNNFFFGESTDYVLEEKEQA